MHYTTLITPQFLVRRHTQPKTSQLTTFNVITNSNSSIRQLYPQGVSKYWAYNAINDTFVSSTINVNGVDPLDDITHTALSLAASSQGDNLLVNDIDIYLMSYNNLSTRKNVLQMYVDYNGTEHIIHSTLINQLPFALSKNTLEYANNYYGTIYTTQLIDLQGMLNTGNTGHVNMVKLMLGMQLADNIDANLLSDIHYRLLEADDYVLSVPNNHLTFVPTETHNTLEFKTVSDSSDVAVTITVANNQVTCGIAAGVSYNQLLAIANNAQELSIKYNIRAESLNDDNEVLLDYAITLENTLNAFDNVSLKPILDEACVALRFTCMLVATSNVSGIDISVSNELLIIDGDLNSLKQTVIDVSGVETSQISNIINKQSNIVQQNVSAQSHQILTNRTASILQNITIVDSEGAYTYEAYNAVVRLLNAKRLYTIQLSGANIQLTAPIIKHGAKRLVPVEFSKDSVTVELGYIGTDTIELYDNNSLLLILPVSLVR